MVPNTDGAMNAEEAVRIARLAGAAGLPKWVKLEIPVIRSVRAFHVLRDTGTGYFLPTMFVDYITKAVERAAYEKMENGRFFATIPGFRGLWAEGKTIETARRELIETLEDWVLLAIRCGDDVPVIGRFNLNKLGRARHVKTRQPA